MTDNEIYPLLLRMSSGDKEAFRTVYEHTHHSVYRTVYFLLNNRQDACDVTSEVYVELLKSVPNYDVSQPFHSWLNGLAIRQAHNWNRKLWRRYRLFNRSKQLEVEEPAIQAEDIALQKENGKELLTQVMQLSYKLRSVIILRYYHDCSQEEIAQHLGIPLNTVKSRHRLGLEKLRQNKELTQSIKEAFIDVH
jgi:RNA polymerase sigma-70 factor (ECF subfamily)